MVSLINTLFLNMKEITSYILEKLKLNDKIVLSSNEHFPTEKDFDWIKKEIVVKDIIEYENIDKCTKKLNNKDRLLRTWLGILSLTKSVPFITKAQYIYSFPGNLGFGLYNRLKKTTEPYTNQELMDFYNDYKNENKKEEDNHINESIYVKGIKLVIPDINATFKIKSFEPDNYTEEAKKLLYKTYRGMFIIPFEIECNGKKADCEIGFIYPAYSYYLYTINGEVYSSSFNFKDKLEDLLT